MTTKPLPLGKKAAGVVFHKEETMAKALHYIDTYGGAHRLAMKVCFVVSEKDMTAAFHKAGVPLTPAAGTKQAYWDDGRDVLGPGQVGVEISLDAGGPLGYAVYAKFWKTGKDYHTKNQSLQFGGELTGEAATLLYEELLPYDKP